MFWGGVGAVAGTASCATTWVVSADGDSAGTRAGPAMPRARQLPSRAGSRTGRFMVQFLRMRPAVHRNGDDRNLSSGRPDVRQATGHRLDRPAGPPTHRPALAADLLDSKRERLLLLALLSVAIITAPQQAGVTCLLE